MTKKSRKYRIRAYDEFTNEYLFWSNSLGWTSFIESDVFDEDEKIKSNLPRGGSWVPDGDYYG